MFKLYLCVAVTVLMSSDAYKILLFFPFPGKSHAILGEGYVRNLLNAGYNVTYITSAPMKIDHPELRQINTSECSTVVPKDYFSIDKIISDKGVPIPYPVCTDLVVAIYNYTLHMKPIHDLLMNPDEKFDAVVIEWMYNELGAGIATVFNCPLIWSSSMVPHTLVLSLIDEYLNPAYSFHLHSTHRSYTLTERIHQLYTLIQLKYYNWSSKNEIEEIYRNIFGPIVSKRDRLLPSYDDVRYNASFMLGNGNIITSDSFALPRNYKDIGGYHISDVQKPLPQDLQNIMDNATTGVIYFSLGSILQTLSMSEKLGKIFLDVLEKANRTVIWKSDVTLPNLPKNVHLVEWAPQQSILGHPNCVLFITHAGLLSVTEAIYYGVPVIGLPFFADQYNNINKATWSGFGKAFKLWENSPENLYYVIEEVLQNSSYRQRAKEVSAIYHHKLTSPGQELVFWIDHVIRTRGALHLRSDSLKVKWYQKLFLDISAIVLLLVILILTVIKYFLRKSKFVVSPTKKIN